MNDIQVEYVLTDGSEKIVQYWWEPIKNATFYNLKNCATTSDKRRVAIWTIKLKNIQP